MQLVGKDVEKGNLIKAREQFARTLIHVDAYRDASEMELALRECFLPIDLNRFRIVRIHWDDIELEISPAIWQELSDKTNTSLSGLPLFVPYKERAGLVALLGERAGANNRLMSCVERLRRYLTFGTGPVSLFVTSEFGSLLHAHSAFVRAESALEGCFYRKGFFYLNMDNEPTPVLDAASREGSHKQLVRETVKKLLAALGTDNQSELMSILAQFAASLEAANVPKAGVMLLFSSVFTGIEQEFPQMTNAVTELLGVNYSYSVHIQAFPLMTHLIRYTTNLLSDLMRQIHKYGIGREKKMMSTILEYIETHYSENLTLAVIAGIVLSSPNYVCKLFRAQMGEHFLDYLTRTRMEHAKTLLSDPTVKIYKVGELVGYDDPTYFSKVFKKNIGLSPKEYRKMSIA